jgi:tRNA pseudouridine55 synthase
MNGIFLVDKSEGVTSNQVVGKVKRLARPFKVGHSGTLDPAATGLLAVLVGNATRALEYLDEAKKTYSMVVRLGQETDTDDKEGVVVSQADPSNVSEAQVLKAIEDFIGVIDQVPPHYSALKRQGKTLYSLARKGIFPELEPRKVEIFLLTLLKFQSPFVELNMICSKGTYARSLARDLGRGLGVGGMLEKLRRTASGSFRVEDALDYSSLLTIGSQELSDRLIPLTKALSHIPTIDVAENDFKRLSQGAAVEIVDWVPGERTRLLESNLTPMLKVVRTRPETLIFVRPEIRASCLVLKPLKVLENAGP